MKSLFKFVLGLLVVAQQFVPLVSLFQMPSAHAAGTVVPTSVGSVEVSCPGYLQNILVYKGKSIRVYDKMTSSSNQYVKIVHNQSSIDRYNGPNNTFGNPIFNIISDAKPIGNSLVYRVYNDLIVSNHANNRVDVAAQFVYKLASVIFPSQVTSTNGFLVTTSINPLNQTTIYKAGSGIPTEGTIKNECQNIYVGFCGDGVVDNGSQNFVEGSPSTFGTIKLNGGEQCDDGNTNNNDSCDNTCKTVTTQPPVCSHQLISPSNGQAELGDVITIKCGQAGSAITSTQLTIKKGTSTVYSSQSFYGAEHTYNWTSNTTGDLTYSCLEYYSGGTVTCGGSFTVTYTTIPPTIPTIDLELDKQYADGTQSCKTYNVGDTIPFKIVITNKGTTGATNFTVKDYIPAGFSFVSASNGGSIANNIVTWTIPGTLAPNQSMSVTLNLKVVSYQPDNLNKAEICAYEEGNEPKDTDSDPCTMGPNGLPSEDDEDSLCIELNQPALPTIDIELTKTIQGGKTMFMSGERITFLITVTNRGTTGVNNFIVDDYLPWGNTLTNLTISHGGALNGTIVTWRIISLAPGQSITLTLQGTVVANSENRDPCNTAEANEYEFPGGPQDFDSNGGTMLPDSKPVEDDEGEACFWYKEPDLQNFDLDIKKSLIDPSKPYKVGDLVGYKIIVSNKGAIPIPTFKVQDYLPAGVDYISSFPAGSYYGTTKTVVRTIQGGLPAFGTKTLYLTGKIISEGTHANCVEGLDYDGLNSGKNPHDIDSNPGNFNNNNVEDDESCVEVTATNPANPAVCNSLTVTPLSGANPLNISYFCDATNATSYSIQLIQNGIITTIGNTNAGNYTITNPGIYQVVCLINGNIITTACSKTVNVGTKPFIDLNIKKVFADTLNNTHAMFNSGDTISFKLIVGNSGNTTATNFTIKDYLPASLQYISSTPNGTATPNGNGTTIVWTIPSLAAGATTEIIIQAKIIAAKGDRNLTEICDYDRQGEPQDPDSNPCTMGPNGTPSEDDEDQVYWNVSTPNPTTSCDNLLVKPSTGTVPYTAQYICNATNATDYTIKIFGGNIGPNGLIVGSTQGGSFTMGLTSSYTIQCLINNATTTSVACTQTITGTPPTDPPPTPVCNYLHVNPQGGMSPTNIQYNCNGSNSNQYVVNITGPSGFNNQSILGSTGGLILNMSGSYTFTCNVGGNTSPACTQTVIITGTRPDIAVTKSVTPTSVKTNDIVTYTVQVTNIGNGDAQEFFVTDNMPNGVVYQSGSCALGGMTTGVSCTFNQPNQLYVFLEAGLKAGQTTTITYQAKVVATGGIIRNVACADPCNNEVAPLTGNNCDDAEITVVPPTSQTGLCNARIQKSATGIYLSGQSVTWTINYGNNGSGVCNNVIITDLGGINNAMVSGTIVATLGSLIPGQTGLLTINSTVYGTSGSQATNIASISTTSTESNTTDNSDDAAVIITVTPSTNNASLGNFVWIDANGNGIQDASELGIGGVMVRLYACNGSTVIATTTTDSNGYYIFNNLPAGSYQVEFVLPNGYTRTTSNAGSNDTTDSDVVGGRSHCITLNAGEINTSVDAGVVPYTPPTNPLTGVQCLDLIATPVYGIPGQTVNFTCNSSGGSVYQIYIYKDNIASTNLISTLYGKTNSYTFATAGKYIAKCVIDGSVDYKLDYYRNHCLDTLTCAYKTKTQGGLCAVRQPLAPFKAQYIAPEDRASISSPIEYCTDTELATLSCYDNRGLNKLTVVRDRDVCNETITINGSTPPVNNASLGNFVWIDANGNGIQDASELGIGGVMVRLYACNGSTVIATTTTDSNGYYIFNNLPAGSYQVEFVLPNGYTRTTSNAGSNDTTDSDVVGGRSHCITLNAGEINTSVDAGVILINNGGGNGGGGGIYQPIPLPEEFSVCGNGRVEIGEYCDYRSSNISLSNNQYIITDGAYKGKICQTNCTITDEVNAPKCMDIDPPSINEGEVFPFRWNIDNSETKVVSSCNNTTTNAVLKSSMVCSFNIYNGKQGTTSPILSTIKIPCYADQGFDTTLMSYWKSKSADADGRKSVIFDAATTKGVYGEYKIELNKIEYKTCDNMGTTKSFDGRVCQYNFVVGEGYMISKGANISTLKDTNILGYYGFSSNTPRFDLYLRGVQQSLSLSAFDPTRNMSYITTEFVDKYANLAENAGVGKKKVPGKSIYLYDNSITLSDNDIMDNSTIIVQGGNLRLEGTIAKNVLYVVPNGSITFGGDANCEKYTNDTLPQIVQGIFVAGQGFASDNYLNTDSSKDRCHNGGLRVRGTLIGKGVDTLIESRRVVLNDRFQGTSADSKTQHIIDGASLLLNPNVSLRTSLPGADEIATVLGVEKK